MVPFRASLPCVAPFVNGVLHPIRSRPKEARKPPRSPTVLNAIDVETIVTNSNSIPIAGVAGLTLVALSAIAVSTQLPDRASVSSMSSAKLPSFLQDPNSVLVDIRSKAQIKDSGQPNLKGLKCRFLSLPYTSLNPSTQQEETISNFGESFAKLKGLREDSKVVLLDVNGRLAPTAAREILKFLDFKTVFYIASGASGRGGLKDSGFAWKVPQSGITLPRIELKGLDLERFTETYKKRPNLVNTGLAVGLITTAGIVLFNEFDVVLEAVGVLGGINLLFRNFFFAKDRKKTIEDLDLLLNDKIAAKEAGDDLKQLATAILELPSDFKSPQTTQTPNQEPVSAPVSINES